MVQSFTWVDPDGVQTPLNITWDIDGRFMPPVSFVTDKLVGVDGESVRLVRNEARTVKLAGYLQADCASTDPVADVYESITSLVTAMNPKRGPGRLRIVNAAGQTRDLVCYYAGGLELPEKFGSIVTKRIHKLALSFTAFDPYWTDTSTTIIDYTAQAGQNFFPFFPLHLSTSQIVTSGFVPNPGTEPTWPVWTIFGPGSVIILQNTDTGQWLNFAANGGLSVSDDDYVIVDTTRGIKAVTRGSDGANMFPYLTNDSVLWPIAPGGSNIQLQMSGAVPGQSTLRLAFSPRYTTV